MILAAADAGLVILRRGPLFEARSRPSWSRRWPPDDR